ncbi:GTPase-associated protein 1-related protein [Actinoplanes sp. NPDC049596]|uniref:GTPase-associated protein 1-related protein n=1 Tax=unclassified Actinoplanes TaxID=2626549 RepID=UPI0034436D80
MSGRAGVDFETLIYTDCVPGQGLQRTAGLQFQARSPGADRAAMTLAQNAVLYEPPAKWMRERRPVAEYPPSFAHAVDGLYVTAAGVYLGREANGGREGNQLTHALVTSDPASYGLIRPAQLFGAPFWTGRPAESTECPPLAEGWEPGPFDIEAAQTFVATSPRGDLWLGRLLSALQGLEGGGPRVLFIGEDPAEVLRWISAATLLLPQRRAVGIGFKVFVTDPAYAVQPVVAVHPDWDSTSAGVANDNGYAVFDLTRNDSSDVPVTTDAGRRVRLLLDEDPYDVLDVVEQAGANGLKDPGQALDLAMTMVLRGPGLSEPIARIAVNWLRDTPATLLAKDRNVLVDKLVGNVKQWPEDILLALDEVARTGQIDPEWAPEVRIALISAELNRASRFGTAEDLKLPPLPAGMWTERHAARCAELVPDELAEWRGPRPFEAVLRVAARFDLQYDVEVVPEAVHAFVTHWADHPEEVYHTRFWGVAALPLRRRLDAELVTRIEQGRAEEVGDAWFDLYRIDGALRESPLYETVLAAQMRWADGAGRQTLIKDKLTAALPQGPAQMDRTARTLWRRTRPTVEDYKTLLEILPPGTLLPEPVFEPLLRVIARPGQATHANLGLLRRLHEHGLVRLPRDHEILLEDDAALRSWCETVTRADPKGLVEHRRILATVSPIARQVWQQELAGALLDVQEPWASHELAALLPEEIRPGYGHGLFETLRKGDGVVTAAVVFNLGGTGLLGPAFERDWPEHLRKWMHRAGDKRRKKAQELVLELAPGRMDEWDALLREGEKSFWSRKFGRDRKER